MTQEMNLLMVQENPEKPKHTPGPWKKWRLAPDSDPQERLIIVSEDNETEVCGIVENEADADLIVAAPALYEALKESALAVHTIGAYHHPSWVTFEECDKPLCVASRGVLVLVNPPLAAAQE